MDFNKVREALQDLIIRLQDAEKGYEEIKKAAYSGPIRNWMTKYAAERHQMHRALESEVALLGGDAEVKTSFLGDLHRIFIDIKINNTNFENQFDAIVTEIERGATTLIEDYDKVIDNVEMPANLKKLLISQKATVQNELDELVNLKEELNAIDA